MKKNMENDTETLGPFRGVIGTHRLTLEYDPPTTQNQMERDMETDMDTGLVLELEIATWCLNVGL